MKENYKLFYKTALKGLDTLENLLNIARKYAKDNGVSEEDLLNASIAPDMFDFKRQVSIYTDGVVGGVYRLISMDKPAMPDANNIDELFSRIKTARECILKINTDDVDENKMSEVKILLPWMGGKHFTSLTFLSEFLFPNNLFHLVTAYNILRMKSVQIGKQDFLGQIEMND